MRAAECDPGAGCRRRCAGAGRTVGARGSGARGEILGCDSDAVTRLDGVLNARAAKRAGSRRASHLFEVGTRAIRWRGRAAVLASAIAGTGRVSWRNQLARTGRFTAVAQSQRTIRPLLQARTNFTDTGHE